MRSYPIPFNESARLEALHNLPGAGGSPEPALEMLAEVARRLLEAPVGHISLIDETVHYSKGVAGIDAMLIPRELSICAHTIMSDDPLVVPDLSRDPRFAAHPMVAEAPHLRFYVGAPLILTSGFRVGSLCIVDTVPRDGIPQEILAMLESIAAAATRILELEPRHAAGTARPRGDDARSEFLALIGHELRTPLTVLSGNVSLMEAYAGDERLRRMATAARRSCEHLRELIETIVAFSDVGTGELTLCDCFHPLGPVMTEALALHLPMIEERGKRARVEAVEITERLQMDVAQVRLVLEALIENAMLHGGEDIVLRAGLSELGHVQISVSDDGTMPSGRTLEELASPFVVGSALDTRSVGGLGLGLPLVRKIAELHGGEFTIVTEAGCTCARVTLPAWRLEGARAEVTRQASRRA